MIDSSSITIRPFSAKDEPFLWEMLYQALFVPEGAEPLPGDIVDRPEISRYVQNWGNSDDIGFIAIDEIEQRAIGAVWIRLLTGDNKGYGYVNDRTPELSIAVLPEYRTRGVGTSLLTHLLNHIRTRYPAISLSASSDNPAVRLYQRLGFETVESIGNSLTMIKRLRAQDRFHAQFARFQPVPLREVRPAGWLLDFLERQSSGLTGNVAVSGYPYGYKFWGSQEDDTKGSYDAWWPYEQTAYWIDGALKCGYLAGDEGLYRQALEEVDFAIEHAAPDGFIGPDSFREKDRWPHTVFFRAVLAQYEITQDERYLEALIRHYRSTPHPMENDRDVTGMEILLYLFQERGQADLLELAESLYARFNRQWPDHDSSLQTLLSDKKPTAHGVTFNEESKLGAILYSATGRREYLEAAVHGYTKLDRHALLADGLHSCSEHIQGKDPRDMHETCDITDYTWSLAHLLQATGKARYADRIEQVIFNALPGAITKDFRALQYLSCPNQVVADSSSNHNLFMRGLNWMSFRPDHEVQCCPGNLHRAMPNFISRMWLRDKDGGLTAALYGPGSLDTLAGADQTPVTITARTRYPYQQSIDFTIQPARPVSFPLAVRIPAWCARASLAVNGQPVEAELKPGSFFKIERLWQAGDRLRLELPFELALDRWPGNGVSLRYGPLTLALPIPAQAEIEAHNSTTRQRRETLGDLFEPRPAVVKPDFPAWNLTPAGRWNYALCVDENSLDSLRVVWNKNCRDPLQAANPPVTVYANARRVNGWRMVHTRRLKQFGHWTENGKFHRGLRTIRGDFRLTPPLPNPERLAERLSEEIEEIGLIPYGATLLRITVFPQAS